MPNKVNIALIQTDLKWEDSSHNLKTIGLLLNKVKKETEIVILPEMFATGFTMNVNNLGNSIGKKELNWLIDKSKKLNFIIVGSLLYQEGNKYYNRMFWVEPKGNVTFYNKRHLFRFSNEDKIITSGKNDVIINYKNINFKLQVCYDLRFPVFSKNNYNKTSKKYDYDVLIYIANWPKKRKYAYQTLLKARSMENQSYTIWVNRVGTDFHKNKFSGDSQVINSLGKVVGKLKKDTIDILYHQLNLNEIQEVRKAFSIGLDWDNFTINN